MDRQRRSFNSPRWSNWRSHGSQSAVFTGWHHKHKGVDGFFKFFSSQRFRSNHRRIRATNRPLGRTRSEPRCHWSVRSEAITGSRLVDSSQQRSTFCQTSGLRDGRFRFLFSSRFSVLCLYSWSPYIYYHHNNNKYSRVVVLLLWSPPGLRPGLRPAWTRTLWSTGSFAPKSFTSF